MKKKRTKLSLLCMGMFLMAWAADAQPANRLHFPLSGYSIAALEEKPAKSPQQALIMFLPATEDFAPNVNVQIQPYAGTMDDYIALTMRQLDKANFKLLQKNVLGKAIAVIEYTGEMNGRALHWYARAEKLAGKVYLVTATATEAQWNEVAPRLKACVDSFHCDGGEQTAASNAAPPRR